jgi:putative transposase
MCERRFRRTPGGVPSLRLHVVFVCKARTAPVLRHEFQRLGNHTKVSWSPSYFASVCYVSESTVRRFIEHQWDVVAP